MLKFIDVYAAAKLADATVFEIVTAMQARYLGWKNIKGGPHTTKGWVLQWQEELAHDQNPASWPAMRARDAVYEAR